jgi:hypothetical protein
MINEVVATEENVAGGHTGRRYDIIHELEKDQRSMLSAILVNSKGGAFMSAVMV